MRFLVDAQLPRRFAAWLNEAGQDALHTLDLPRKNLTSDGEIIARARQDGRVVVSKDADFAQSFLITGEPSLLLISTGNIDNAGLEKTARQFGRHRSRLCFQPVRRDHPRCAGDS